MEDDETLCAPGEMETAPLSFVEPASENLCAKEKIQKIGKTDFEPRIVMESLNLPGFHFLGDTQ